MKTIIYIQEMLSFLVVVLMICFVAGFNYFPLKTVTVVKHVLPSNDTANKFSGYKMIEKRLLKTKVIHFNFTGEALTDDKEVCLIRAEAIRLKHSADTGSIIQIHFGNTTSYGRFAQLVNMMLIDDNRQYCLWKDDFYIFFGR